MSIQIKKEENYILLRTSEPVFEPAEGDALYKELEKNSAEHSSFILDFSQVKEVKTKALRRLKELAAFCIEKNISMVLFAEREVHQFFLDHGVNYLIPSFKDFNEAKTNLPRAEYRNDSKSDDIDLRNAVTRAVIYTLRTMCRVEVVSGVPFTRNLNETPSLDLASVASVSTENFKSIFIMGFPKDTLTNLMKKMLEDSDLVFGDLVKSGATEFLNCMMGEFKKDLRGKSINSSIPSLVMGRSLGESPIQLVVNDSSTIIPFSSPEGSFFVEFMAFKVRT